MERKKRAKWLAALSGVMLLAVQIPALPATVMKPGVKRCQSLQYQLAAAVKSKHSQVPSRVKALETQAQQFCSHGKTAQGNRAYVKALASLGIKPDFDTTKPTGDIQ